MTELHFWLRNNPVLQTVILVLSWKEKVSFVTFKWKVFSHYHSVLSVLFTNSISRKVCGVFVNYVFFLVDKLTKKNFWTFSVSDFLNFKIKTCEKYSMTQQKDVTSGKPHSLNGNL